MFYCSLLIGTTDDYVKHHCGVSSRISIFLNYNINDIKCRKRQ